MRWEFICKQKWLEHMVSFSNGNLLAVLTLITEKRSKYTASVAQHMHMTEEILSYSV